MFTARYVLPTQCMVVGQIFLLRSSPVSIIPPVFHTQFSSVSIIPPVFHTQFSPVSIIAPTLHTVFLCQYHSTNAPYSAFPSVSFHHCSILVFFCQYHSTNAPFQFSSVSIIPLMLHFSFPLSLSFHQCSILSFPLSVSFYQCSILSFPLSVSF